MARKARRRHAKVKSARSYKKGHGVRGPRGRMLYGAAARNYKRAHKKTRARRSR
jgi:hypothetical protein